MYYQYRLLNFNLKFRIRLEMIEWTFYYVFHTRDVYYLRTAVTIRL
jgi:hypothetical protein